MKILTQEGEKTCEIIEVFQVKNALGEIREVYGVNTPPQINKKNHFIYDPLTQPQ